MIECVNKLTPPKDIGSSEYGAIYELLEHAETEEEALSICEEIRHWAAVMAKIINSSIEKK